MANPPGHGHKTHALKKHGKKATNLNAEIPDTTFEDRPASAGERMLIRQHPRTPEAEGSMVSKRNLLGMYDDVCIYCVYMAYHHMDRSWDTTPW